MGEECTCIEPVAVFRTCVVIGGFIEPENKVEDDRGTIKFKYSILYILRDGADLCSAKKALPLFSSTESSVETNLGQNCQIMNGS